MCSHRLAVILLAVLASVFATVTALHADGFGAIDLGYSVADWFPVDLEGDGTWKLAIATSTVPAQVGVFDPADGAWIFGPFLVPITGRNWGIGDYDSDGNWEVAYLDSLEIRLFDPSTGADMLLWTLPMPREGEEFLTGAVFWGVDSAGSPLVGLHYDTVAIKLGVLSFPQLLIGGVYRICRVSDGSAYAEVSGGSPDWWALHDPSIGSILAISEIGRIENEGMGWWSFEFSATLHLQDEHWNGVSSVPLAWQGAYFPNFGPEYQPATGGYTVRNVALGTDPFATNRLIADVKVDIADQADCLSEFNVATLSTSWSQDIDSMPRFHKPVAFDISATGERVWILPLVESDSWQIRTLESGAIIDTLDAVPSADLWTGPLRGSHESDLFYIKDSSLYIWGLPAIINDDGSVRASIAHGLHFRAFPNPFNGGVQLAWEPGWNVSSIEIFNVLGQPVFRRDLRDSPTLALEWDAQNDLGAGLPSGVYLARLIGRWGSTSIRLVLVR